jgi:hypothetical protein
MIKKKMWNSSEFTSSIFRLSRRNNLNLIFDESKNRAYTLTVHGDRQRILQTPIK